MSIDEAQQQVDAWIHTYGVRYFSELTNMAVTIWKKNWRTCCGSCSALPTRRAST